MITEQEIFDKIVSHLRVQGCKSLSSDSSNCLYRGSSGLKCAFGILIPDSIYHEKMEGLRALFLIKRNAELRYLIPFVDLLQDLQNIHDRYNTYEWESHFIFTAYKYQLKYKP